MPPQGDCPVVDAIKCLNKKKLNNFQVNWQTLINITRYKLEVS